MTRVSDEVLRRCVDEHSGDSLSDNESVAMARELLAAREVIEEARGHAHGPGSGRLAEALARYDETGGE